MQHELYFSDEELEHIQMALMVYSGELVRDMKKMPQTQENTEYIDRQREINCYLATYINGQR